MPAALASKVLPLLIFAMMIPPSAQSAAAA
jgi:hypothetical protein